MHTSCAPLLLGADNRSLEACICPSHRRILFHKERYFSFTIADSRIDQLNILKMVLFYVFLQDLKCLGTRFKSDDMCAWIESLKIQHAQAYMRSTVDDEWGIRFSGENVLVDPKNLIPDVLELLFIDKRDGKAISRSCLQRHTLHDFWFFTFYCCSTYYALVFP